MIHSLAGGRLNNCDNSNIYKVKDVDTDKTYWCFSDVLKLQVGDCVLLSDGICGIIEVVNNTSQTHILPISSRSMKKIVRKN